MFKSCHHLTCKSCTGAVLSCNARARADAYQGHQSQRHSKWPGGHCACRLTCAPLLHGYNALYAGSGGVVFWHAHARHTTLIECACRASPCLSTSTPGRTWQVVDPNILKAIALLPFGFGRPSTGQLNCRTRLPTSACSDQRYKQNAQFQVRSAAYILCYLLL